MKNLSKILMEAAAQKSKKDKIAYLKQNTNSALNKLLKYTFDPEVKFLLPEGEPPYKPSPFQQPGNLYNEIKRLYLFIEGGQANITNFRRESMFIETLEFVDAEDAKLLVAVKDKKLPYKGLTEEIIKEAIPEVFK